jgi:hypothetical protein
LEKTAEELHLMSKGEVQLCHLLFGGFKQTRQHDQYELEVMSAQADSSSCIQVLGHSHICEQIPTMTYGLRMSELKARGIFIADLRRRDDDQVIELLIGADYYAKILT